MLLVSLLLLILLQVFARTVICRDLDVATRVARTDNLDCITLEGLLLQHFFIHVIFFIESLLPHDRLQYLNKSTLYQVIK